MARRSISAAIFCFCAVSAGAQAFGRFGYTEAVDVPGFVVERKGFKVRQDQADWFSYESPSAIWRPVATDDTSQTVLLSGIGRAAEKARFDLYGTGFSLFFRHGIGFRLTSNQAPFLTWSEGSVGPGVPTPATKWVLISFRDAQPPVLISTPEREEAFEIVGKPGDWRLRSASAFQGWIRVTAPIGLKTMATNTAASLGSLMSQVQPLLKCFTDPVPKLLHTEIAEEPTAVTATWTFDRPFAVVPLPVVLANLGGYPLKVETPVERIDSSDPTGPISVSKEAVFKVRFPVRRIPTGRAISLGQPPDGIATVSTIDIPSIAELALANFPAGRDELTREAAEEAMGKYLGEAKYVAEPYSNQQLPYGADGYGIDLAAAYALLMQSTITTVKASSEPNSLLTSVMWRRDWRTWTLWTPDPALSRRAASLAALAAAFCSEPARRLDAGMLEAGLSAQEGLRIWQKRNNYATAPELPKAAFEGLRRSLFFYAKRNEADEAFLRSLLSEIRIYSDHAVRAAAKEGSIALSWNSADGKPSTIILASAYPIEASPALNLTNLVVEEALGFTVLRFAPTAVGPSELLIKPPDWAAPLPAYAAPPRF